MKARVTNLTGRASSLRIGKFSRVDGEIIIYPGAQVVIGDYCYIGPETRVWAYASVTLDDYVIVAHHVSIMDSTTHPVAFSERKRQIREQLEGEGGGQYDLRPSPIRFEEGAWVCAGAIVLRGVTVGREAIVSAGTVVRHSIPPRSTFKG